MATPAISLQNKSAPATTQPLLAWDKVTSAMTVARRAIPAIWSALPRGWWVMPCAGVALLLTLASGQGLSFFVGKYAWTGKDFQEIIGPSLLAGAVAVAAYLWCLDRSVCRTWILCVPTALLCRELHFSGTGIGIYVALVALAVYAVKHRQRLQPIWNCHSMCSLWLGAVSWYALAVTVDSGVWKFLPHSHWWSVNLEETLESGGHLAILVGVLASVLVVAGKPISRTNHRTELAGSH